MAPAVRRVVTGHDVDGRAIVRIDETTELAAALREGVSSRVLWTTEGFPVDNSGDQDAGQRPAGISLPGGTIFRVIEFRPGHETMMHRTETVDYAIVLQGEIDMEMDGEIIHFRTGDTLVQRGTVHNWVNTSTEPCLMAFVLIDAQPVTVGDRVLGEEGTPGHMFSAD